MANVLKMPRLSDTMVEGVLVSWQKKEGDAVEAGEVLAEVETDKATMELESFDSGILRKILLPEGKGVPVGGVIAIIADDEEEDISALLAGDAPAPRKAAASAPAAAAAPVAVAAEVAGDGRVKASPLAKKIAADKHLDLRLVTGSGPGGRIVRRDVEAAAPQAAAPAPVASAPVASVPVAAPVVVPAAPMVVEELPAVAVSGEGERIALSQMRKTIARRLTEAKNSAPHFYLTAEIDMAPAMALREQLNQAAGGSVKISVNDLVLKACANALVAHPKVNSSFEGDSILQHSAVHMSFAAAIEDGLITPTIRDCHTKSIGQIAKEARALAERAVARKLKPEEFSGGTFTVSNLGMYGIVEFTAIINPPQAAILAVGAVREIPVVVGGQLAVGKRMRVTLSCDHRAIDGAVGAQFLATLRETLENPMRLLL